MLNTQFIKSLTDLRNDPKSITKLAQDSDNPVYILDRGKPVSVLIDIRTYEEIVDKLEDALDSLEMRKFEKTNYKKNLWISHTKLKKKLNLA